MSAEAWQITWFTLGVAALSTLAILPPGVALAWLLARHDWRGKSLVELNLLRLFKKAVDRKRAGQGPATIPETSVPEGRA